MNFNKDLSILNNLDPNQIDMSASGKDTGPTAGFISKSANNNSRVDSNIYEATFADKVSRLPTYQDDSVQVTRRLDHNLSNEIATHESRIDTLEGGEDILNN